IRNKIVGGDFTATDESGDVFKLTTGLAKKSEEAGVEFRYSTSITRLITEGAGAAARVTGVEVINPDGRHEVLKADTFVVAMGSFSQQ
ncbi:FAD-dependent oxidoreductase, partial [Salmonella enterica]